MRFQLHLGLQPHNLGQEQPSSLESTGRLPRSHGGLRHLLNAKSEMYSSLGDLAGPIPADTSALVCLPPSPPQPPRCSSVRHQAQFHFMAFVRAVPSLQIVLLLVPMWLPPSLPSAL